MRKIIFLDFDGVLNTCWWERKTPIDKYGYAFDPNTVANLAKIINETGADIVISSSWKFMGLSQMLDMWEERGLPGKIIDITPNTVSDEVLLDVNLDYMEFTPIRGIEIKEWLETKGKKVSHYAILDDMDSMLPEQKDHLVLTDPTVGITDFDALKAIAILNNGIYQKNKRNNKGRNDVREKTIEITKANYQDFQSLDLVAISYAFPGAMGEGGGIFMITTDATIYHTNIVHGDLTIEEAFLICPPLKECRFGILGDSTAPDGWSSKYMGFGNFLVIKYSILNKIREKNNHLSSVELYQQWMSIVIECLNKK